MAVGIAPVAKEIDWSVILTMAKSRYSPIKQWYPKLLETATADREEGTALGEKFLLATFEMVGDLHRNLADSQKEADRLEAERILTSTAHMKVIQRNMILEADVTSYQRDIAALHAELIRLQEMRLSPAETSPLASEDTPSPCKA